MPSIDRTTIKSGPALLTWNTAKLYFRDGLTIAEEVSTFDVTADAVIGSQKRVNDRMITLTGTPVGQWKDLAVIFALLSATPGTRLFGASDKAATVHFKDGDLFTFHNCGLTTLPPLSFSPLRTMLGSIGFECRVKNDTDPTAANAIFTRSNTAFNDTSFAFANIPTVPYTLTWGADDWEGFNTRDGVVITPRVAWSDIPCDNIGIVEKEVTGLEVTAAFTPQGVAQSYIDAKLAMQNSAAAARGAIVSATTGVDFVLAGTGVYVTLANAILRKAGYRAQTGQQRHAEFEAVACLDIDTGVPVAQMTVGTEAPE